MSLSMEKEGEKELPQRFSLLHMTLQEVAALANEQLEVNPLLETVELSGGNTMFSDISLDAMLLEQDDNEANEEDEEAPKAAPHAGEFYRDLTASDGERDADFLDFAVNPESLSEYLALQLVDYPLEEEQKKLCRYLIDSLDERGFFTESLEEIAERERVDAFELTQMLYVLQSLEPAGVGARDLQECLILQLAAGSNFNSNTVRIVKEGLSLLSENKIAEIAALLGVGEEEAERACAVIRGLSPIPSRGYYTGEDRGYFVPDAIIYSADEELVVQMNDSLVPHLVLDPDYEGMDRGSSDAELKAYLAEHREAAEHLIEEISARRDLLYRLLCEIAARQPRFFRDGRTLMPMKTADLAEALGVPVAVITRGIRGKYVACAAGTVSLLSLFYNEEDNGENAVAAAVVKRKLLGLIAAEEQSAPLTDAALCEKLCAVQIVISEELVEQYREELGIPNAAGRKDGWQ